MVGTCYMAEKEFFDKMNIDQGILKQIKESSELMRKNYIENLDIASKIFDGYIKMRVNAIKSYDNYAHTMIESYAKMWSQFNKNL
ncbi:MAG: hypothetical protein OEL56_04570 [Nitrosopumilus sp.]|nr:hypothetical protein [Nitrosopumilus sp.]